MPRAARSEEEFRDRFWAKIQTGAADDCWPWTGARTTYGYGSLRREQTTFYAHRIAFEIEHGPLAPDECVMHSCDNPPCVNPRHLLRGSKLDNNRDCAAKGRSGLRGIRAPQAKLDDDTVRAIRRDYANGQTQRALAAVYGVSQMTISQAVRRKTWSHVS